MNPTMLSRRSFAALGTGALLAATARPAFAAAAAEQPNGQMAAVLETLASLHPLPLPTLTPDQARNDASFFDAYLGTAQKAGKPALEAVASVRHVLIPTTGGASLIARVYTPSGSGPFPVVVYYHGGGWVIANLDTYENSPRAIANAAKAIVVSVAYRQAPEHKYPAAAEDAYMSYRWVRRNAASLGGDPKRVAVLGESAGGNLAAVASLTARRRGDVVPDGQVLVYPIADDAFDTASYQQYAAAKPLDQPSMKWFFAYYLPTPLDGRRPDVSVARADLRGLPRTTIINAEIDPLRDDGAKMETALRAAGVAVRRTVYPGVTHEFFGMTAVLDASRTAVAEAATALDAAFTKGA